MGKRVQKSSEGGRARTIEGAGPTDLLYHVEHHTEAPIFGASSHGELRTLADAITATTPPAMIRPVTFG